MECMTNCEYCDEELKSYEWREHLISENRLVLDEENIVKIAIQNMIYIILMIVISRRKGQMKKMGRFTQHNYSDIH